MPGSTALALSVYVRPALYNREESRVSTRLTVVSSTLRLPFDSRRYWAIFLNVKLARLLFCCATGLLWTSQGAAVRGDGPPATNPVDFNDRVRPILARHCFKCHGPDEKARKAKLRLDVGDDAKKPAGSGERPIVPGPAR